MRDPSYVAFDAVHRVMQSGSKKDGKNNSWRARKHMYHLSKAASHLSTHIKHMHDPRQVDGENHLELALTRIAMVLTQIEDKGVTFTDS